MWALLSSHARSITSFIHVLLGSLSCQSMPQQSVDIVVAADLVPYFGDVTELMRAMADVVRPGGLVTFNADMLDEDDGTSGAGGGGNGSGRAYELRFTGR